MNCHKCGKRVLSGKITADKKVMCGECEKALRKELEYLNRHIEAGKRFVAEGSDCGLLNALNICARNAIAREIEGMEEGQ